MIARRLFPLLVSAGLLAALETNAVPQYLVLRNSQADNRRSLNEAQSAEWTSIQSMRRKLASIVVPHAHFEDRRLNDAFDWIEKASIEYDPEKAGVKIHLNIEDQPEEEQLVGGSDFGPRITMEMRNIPLIELIRYSAGLVNLGYRITSSGVYIEAPNFREPDMPIVDFEVDPRLFRDVPDRIVRQANGEEYKSKDLSGFFNARGVPFLEGATAILHKNSNLILRNTKENLDKCRAIIEEIETHLYPPGCPAYQPDWKWKWYAKMYATDLEELRRELESTQLENVSIQDITVEEAVEKIAIMAGASAVENALPDPKLQILVRRKPTRDLDRVRVLASESTPISENSAVGRDKGATISYSAEKASLLEVVRAIAAQSGMQLWFESPNGRTKRLAVVDRDLKIPLVRADLIVAEDALLHAGFSIQREPTADTQDELAFWFEQPSMLYARSTGRLTVQDTPENFLKLANELDSAWRDVDRDSKNAEPNSKR